MAIRTASEYRYYLRADLASRGKSCYTCRDRLYNYILTYQRLLRTLEYYSSCKDLLFRRVMIHYYEHRLCRLGALLGFSIGPGTCGPGLVLVHYGSINISGLATLGCDCRVHSCVNIGEFENKAPQIGDRVYIGPGAKLYGDISIGNDVAIGANAVVTHSVPNSVTIAGVPARVISETGSGSLIPNCGSEVARHELRRS
jgi:serine O-acetyltransferase